MGPASLATITPAVRGLTSWCTIPWQELIFSTYLVQSSIFVIFRGRKWNKKENMSKHQESHIIAAFSSWNFTLWGKIIDGNAALLISIIIIRWFFKYGLLCSKKTDLLTSSKHFADWTYSSLSQSLPDNHRGLPGYGGRLDWLSGIWSKKPSIQTEVLLLTF